MLLPFPKKKCFFEHVVIISVRSLRNKGKISFVLEIFFEHHSL